MNRTPVWLPTLRQVFGTALQEGVILANYCTARVGGPADAMLQARDASELEQICRLCWTEGIPFLILGSGSNLLFADQGYRGLIVINRARNIRVDAQAESPSVLAESGANFSMLARQVALRGLSGLEWAAAVPGTVGGAIYGNAGAFGSDTSRVLRTADILQPSGVRETLTVQAMDYGYRTSALKRTAQPGVILSGRFNLSQSDQGTVQERMHELTEKRRNTQPPGATMGSMFKNPAGDYAGRLIEAAGLKGTRNGGAAISEVHANFFVNDENATAADILGLIRTAQQVVAEKFGVRLELEIELQGEWDDPLRDGQA